MTQTIHDLPRIERPREKLVKYGPDKLSNPELLAIILRNGQKGLTILDITKKFFKDYDNEKILSMDYEELKNLKGFGNVKACEILATIELGKRLLKQKKNIILLSPKSVWEETKDIRESMKEHFLIIYLNSRQQKIAKDIISIGTLNASLIHPREVFEPAIKNFAAGIILVHNHPSNNPEPSEADIEITNKLVRGGKILDIEVIDHVIVTESDWFSFKENSLVF